MDVVTLVIAVVGLVLSVASLCWQVPQHRLSGPRVQAELLWGGIAHDQSVTGSIRGSMEAFQYACIDTAVVVKGRNQGRLLIDITGFKIERRSGFGYSLPGWHPNPTLLHRLESGSEATFYVPLEEVQHVIGVIGEGRRGLIP